MKYNFKEEVGRQGMSSVEITSLSKLGRPLTADNLTDISNDARSVNLGRVTDSLEIIGIDPGEFVSGISGNTSVYSNILEGQRNGLSADAWEKAEELSDKYCLSESSMKLRGKVEKAYRKLNVSICGMLSSGKLSLAQYLMNAPLGCTGPVLSRRYKSVVVLSQSCAGERLVYPVNGYIYENDDSSCISAFLSMSGKERRNAQKKLGPPCYGRMDDANKEYVIFFDSPVLNKFAFTCSNSDDESDANCISNADIMMIMLSESAEFLPKLTRLLSSAKEKWNERMAEHMLFIIPKSDWYVTDDKEMSGVRKIGDVKTAYKIRIAECISHICDDDEERARLSESLAGQVVHFSSIYKNVTVGVCDASHNFEFDNAVKLCVKAAERDKEIDRRTLNEELEAYSHENVCLTQQQKRDIMTEFNSIFSGEVSRMKAVLNDEYDNLMNVGALSELIKENGITRTKEGRQKILSMVNSRLSDMALKVVDKSLFRIYSRIRDIKILTDNEAVSCKLEETVIRCISKSYNQKLFISAAPGAGKDSKAGNISAGTIVAAGMASTVLPLMPVAAMLGPIAGVAGAVVSSYYAQTNFEKNTARKIVAAYDENKVKDNLIRKLISSRIVPVQQEVTATVESFGGDKDLEEYAKKLSEVLAD